MDVDIWAVVAATVAMFAVGAFWYMVPFAKAWGHMHGFDKLSKAEQQKAQKEVGPLYGFQIVVTVFSAFALAQVEQVIPESYSLSVFAMLIWFGFVMPAQVSAVIFGGTKPEFVAKKIAIMAGESLLHLVIAAKVIEMIQK